MKRKQLMVLGLVLIIVASMFSFSACGKTENTDEADTSASTESTEAKTEDKTEKKDEKSENVSEETAQETAQETVTVNGITYTLDGGWKYDEANGCFTNGGITATIVTDITDECKSAEERYKISKELAEEGIDAKKVKVNGQDGVYTEEAVNEIMSCELYYYVNGKEHELNIETGFKKYKKAKSKINKFISGISW